MDYRSFTCQVPGNLAAPVYPQIQWYSHSGQDARIDPFGEGTPEARGKSTLYLNWCNPSEPVSHPTATSQRSRDLFRQLAGRDVGTLNKERLPKVIVSVKRDGKPISET